MKILICYFSGTGNTKRVVDKFAECLEENENEVTLQRVEHEFNLNIEDFDLIGFAYPVHAFNAPEIILDFVKKLEKLENKKDVFIINTSGEPLKLNNISSIKLTSLLKKKNMIVKYEYHYVMPYNIIFRHTDRMAYRMWETAKKIIPLDVKELLEKKPAKLKKVFMGRFIAYIFRIEHWGGKFNGKHYKALPECINCNCCVNICPTKNITVKDGELHFGKNCIMCMRCSFLCQKNAIKIGFFNKWKVNGVYNFNNPGDTSEDKHKKYCKKAYKRYFRDCEARLENATQKVDKPNAQSAVKADA